ncbi:MAG: GNAT family N-acetyltransferase [Rhodobacterales bacterium 12-65-15]|nr:MAG: GNAT family N-acetyltransferase [Rhodobacterales bacterium 12-65-15]
MRLSTDRLILRRARREDLDDLHLVLSHPAVMRYWTTPEHETLAESRTFLAAMIDAGPDTDDFVIERDGRVIGKAGAWRLPELGYLLHPDHWRQGLGREALGAVIPHLFAAHDLAALTADVDPRNSASLRLLGSLGFVETGRAEKTIRWRDEWSDSIYLALPRPM